ncbi:BnaC03g55080D [Brassica napus]|uniref:BnaC03g55080D protein n=1 Tax=Brassica napus TaxID=3708 RepID=A0A078H0P8_BRANA|nr:BnaC03g55080D [Brassica napus]
MGGGPRVLVATSINPQIVGGRLFLNATSGTHIYFDKETTARETYFYRLVAQDTRLPSAAPLLKSYAKVESLSIAELNEFVISASSRGSDDDNGNNNSGAISVRSKVEMIGYLKL